MSIKSHWPSVRIQNNVRQKLFRDTTKFYTSPFNQRFHYLTLISRSMYNLPSNRNVRTNPPHDIHQNVTCLSSGMQHFASPRPFPCLGQYGGCLLVKQKDPLVPIGVCCPMATYSPALGAILGPDGHLLEHGSAIDSFPPLSILCAM